ncbi:MAG: arginyl-tRNA synthetase [Solirubrobacteraceae bacterium]|nr:arginyl-tRNA synthetase [Solirubrobacteraceae bacterium]
MSTPIDDLRAAVEAAASDLRNGAAPPRTRPTLERPKQAGFGDYSTNAAMLLAPALKAPPRDIAAKLGDALSQRLGPQLERVEVAGPGFLNLFLADDWYADSAAAVIAAGDGYGGGQADPPERIQVEFVSANPTGPLTAASGRHAAYGDALRRLLRFMGHEVQGEYYFNDAGAQIRRLGESIRARARGDAVPADGYQGEYIAELAQQIPGAADLDPDEAAAKGVELMIAKIRATLEAYRVTFDNWFLERSLHDGDPSPVDRALARLDEQGNLYRADGALWLRTSALGDDKDRVIKRSTGEPTYFASDVAYLESKLERGFDRFFIVLGSDHHGYLARMRAAVAALGAEPTRLEMPILQFVHVVERGERSSMSKRRGDFITLDELIGQIGVDATRFFMLQRSHDSTVDLDVDLAREESAENPVYYVQYAHARIASVLRNAGEERVAAALAQTPRGLALEPAERELVKKLLAYPGEIAEAAEKRAPHRIATYAHELAQAFAAFYRDCPVLKAPDEDLKSFRIGLSVATGRTIANALGLLGVSAPDSM